MAYQNGGFSGQPVGMQGGPMHSQSTYAPQQNPHSHQKGASHQGSAADMQRPLATGHMGELFGGHHVYQHPTQFLFKDKTLISGDIRNGTRVFNPDGSLAFETKDKRMTLRNKETVYDALGKAIATLHKKTMSLHGTWEIYRGESIDKKDFIADVKPGFVSITGKTIKVLFKDSDEPVFVIKGNFLGKSFEFTQKDRIVARSKRQGKFHSASNFVSGEDTFVLDCQPGFDTALLVLATLVIDDILAGKREND